MINRREVLASGLAATLLAQGAGAAIAPGPLTIAATAARDPGTGIFVAAARSPAAHRAAAEAARLGAEIRLLGDDVTPVYEWLDRRLRIAPCRIAGLSSMHALFVIERLGWDRGLRTVWRGADRGLPEGFGPTAPGHRHVVITAQQLPRAGDTALVSWLLVPRESLGA